MGLLFGLSGDNKNVWCVCMGWGLWVFGLFCWGFYLFRLVFLFVAYLTFDLK